MYSEIQLLRPKIQAFYLLKTLFAKFKLLISQFSMPSVQLIRAHLWDCPKGVFKTTFGQSQRWSEYRNFNVYLCTGFSLQRLVSMMNKGSYQPSHPSSLIQALTDCTRL